MADLGHWRADLARPVRRIRGVANTLDERGDEMSEGIAGRFFVGDAPLNKVDLSPDAVALANAMSERDLRRFIREEVHKVLDDIANEVRTNEAFQPVTTHKQAGICCACLDSGDDMEWVGHRLAHKTDECRRKAAEMPPVREHRG